MPVQVLLVQVLLVLLVQVLQGLGPELLGQVVPELLEQALAPDEQRQLGQPGAAGERR